MSGYFAEDWAIKGLLGVKYWMARGVKGLGREGGREGSLWLQQLAAGAKKPNRRLISRVTQLWEPSRRICRRAIWSIDGNKAGDIADRPVLCLQLCSTAKTTDFLVNSSPKTAKRKGKFIYYYYYYYYVRTVHIFVYDYYFYQQMHMCVCVYIHIYLYIIIIIIIYLSSSWATCWTVPVSRTQKSLQRSSTMIPSANWTVVLHYSG